MKIFVIKKFKFQVGFFCGGGGNGRRGGSIKFTNETYNFILIMNVQYFFLQMINNNNKYLLFLSFVL